MIPSFYLAATSALIHQHDCSAYSSACVRAHWREAFTAAAHASDADGDAARAACAMQACADVSLIVDDAQEAEDWFRRSLRGLQHSPALLPWSWRAAALQALFRDRLETAAACFLRLSHQEEQRPLQLEALAFLVVIGAQLGMLSPARQALAKLVKCVEEVDDDDWRALASCIELDVAASLRVHEKPALSDHAYWLSAQRMPSGHAAAWSLQPPRATARMDGFAALLGHRETFVQRLAALAQGDADEFAPLQEALDWGGSQAHDVRIAAGLEIFKACLAGEHSQLADMAMKALAPAAADRHPHSRREFMYCQSRLRQQQGRLDESMALYSRYAACSMEFLRREGAALARIVAQEFLAAEPPRDDVSVRLPARYRRAYEYMLRSIDRSDLSIPEVAESIGVTERALQVTFKSCLGEAPRQVLRRLRLQHIREALICDEDARTPIMEVASRYGILNRTSLLAGFRKYFREAPSDAVERALCSELRSART